MSNSSNTGCFAFISGIFTSKPKSSDPSVYYLPADSEEDEQLPYRLRDDFLSPAEQSFYLVLKNMMKDYLTICPKVSLADIFFVTRPNENMKAYNRINRKHVDFLICDPGTMRPSFAIELDDSSHRRADREERDEFVDQVFQTAELPLLHIPTRATYNTSELGFLFKQALQKGNGIFEGQQIQGEGNISMSPIHKQHEPDIKPPICPKCGVSMVLRIAKSGNQAGRQFYGCPNFPKCRVIFSVNQ